MKVQKSKLAFIAIVSTLLFVSFQNCGKQLVTISSDNPGYQNTGNEDNGITAIEEPVKKIEVKVDPVIAVEGETSKMTFTLSQVSERPVEVVLTPVNDLAQTYVEQKKIVTRYTFPPGETSIKLELPLFTLSNPINQKIEFEAAVSDDKFAFVSSKKFNIFVIPANNADGAASITADDVVTASHPLKGSIVLLNKLDVDAAIDWQIIGSGDAGELKLFSSASGTFKVPAGQQYISFSIPTIAASEYITDKNLKLKFSSGQNLKLVEAVALDFKLVDQKPHSSPAFAKSPASLISKDFRNGVKLSVMASGVPAPVYTWFVNGQPVPGNLSEYTLPSPAEAKQFVVKVVAKNIYGEAISSDATIAFGCASNETIKNGMCEVNTVRDCSIAYGVGQQTWMTDRWSNCVPVSCNAGFVKLSMSCGCPDNQHIEGGKCVSNSISCTIANGTGSRTWNGTDYGDCKLVSCNSSYSAFGNTCACQAEQTLDVTDNLCKYKVRKWLLSVSYDSIAIPVRCSGSYKPFSRPVNGVYNVSGIIIAGASPWLDPHAVDPNFSVSVMRVIETSTCGGEFLDGGYPGTNTLCYSRNCAMKMYRVGEGLSLTK